MLDPQWGMFIVESIEQVILNPLDRLPSVCEFGQSGIQVEFHRETIDDFRHLDPQLQNIR